MLVDSAKSEYRNTSVILNGIVFNVSQGKVNGNKSEHVNGVHNGYSSSEKHKSSHKSSSKDKHRDKDRDHKSSSKHSSSSSRYLK